MLAFLVFSIFLIGLIGLLPQIWNTRRDKKAASDAQSMSNYPTAIDLTNPSGVGGIPTTIVANEEFIDLTDFQLKSFRYPV